MLALVTGMVFLGALAMAALIVGQKEAAIVFTALNLLGLGAFTWLGAIFGLRRQKV